MGVQDEEGFRGIPKFDHVDHESVRRARELQEDGSTPAGRTALPRHGGATGPYAKPASPEVDPLVDGNIDIPLDRMAREFRKRAGRAFGLGDDAKAEALRGICQLIETVEKRFEKS